MGKKAKVIDGVSASSLISMKSAFAASRAPGVSDARDRAQSKLLVKNAGIDKVRPGFYCLNAIFFLNFMQRIAADAAAAAHRDDPSLVLAAKAKHYAAMSSGDAGTDSDRFLVDFAQKRYDDGEAERDVDSLALAASSDSHCQLHKELEEHAANQISQTAAAKKLRETALQVCLR
jgi:hypothetical protein